jgi:PAS domain S-box-containing protein
MMPNHDLDQLRTYCKNDEAFQQVKSLVETFAQNAGQTVSASHDVTLQLMSVAVSNANDVILITGAQSSTEPDPAILYVNPAFTRMTGYTSEEVIGKSPKLLQGPKTDRQTLYKIRTALKTWQAIQAEVLNYRKDGTEFWVELNIVPVADKTGWYTHWVAVQRNITERKRVADALIESEKRFRALTDVVPVMIWEVNANKECTYLNKVFLEFTGQTLEQEIGKIYSDTIHPEDLQRALSVYVKAFDERQPFQMEFRVRRHDGEYRWVLGTHVPKYTPDGVFTGYIGSCIDITERKQAEDQQRHHTAIVNQINEAIISIGLDFKIMSWNKAAEKMYGYSQIEAIGRLLTDLVTVRNFHHEDEQAAWRSVRESGSWQGEVVHSKRSGEDFPVFILATAMTNDSGDLVGVLIVIRDLTEVKKAETEKEQLTHQLLQSQKMEAIGTLASGISHDFNNILTSISGYAALLRPALECDPQNAKRLARIEEAAHRATALTRQILSFSRRDKLDMHPLWLADYITSIVSLVEPTLDKRIEIKLDVKPNLPCIEGDKSQLEQVLLNLAVNAADAIKQNLDEQAHGQISFTLRTDPLHESLFGLYAGNPETPFLHLIVSDDGVGIPETIRSKIFEPFFTTKDVGKGTGLGLAMVYGIVNRHNGFIRIESEVGKGTSFHLYFPTMPLSSKRNQSDEQTIQDTYAGSGTVLIIDDDESILDMAAEALELSGYTVLTAADGEAGLAHFAKQAANINLVILDMNMPKMSGAETFERLKMIQPAVKVLLATGYSEAHIANSLFKDGVADVIHKPYGITELVRKVSEMIG